MKRFAFAAICGLFAASFEPAKAYPFTTTCSNVGVVAYCNSGNAKGFSGQAYSLGGTTYANGYLNGQPIRCQTYPVGSSLKTDCR